MIHIAHLSDIHFGNNFSRATWDAVVDTSAYVPRIMKMSAELLGPNVGTYLDPGWAFDERSSPAAYGSEALRWRDVEGARIIGGCCGTTAEHIAAVSAALARR